MLGELIDKTRLVPAKQILIRLRVPDKFAQVSFNGQSVSSVGATREYATPTLEAGRPSRYTTTVTWSQGDQPKTMEQTVDIARGETRTIDFTAAPKDSRK